MRSLSRAGSHCFGLEVGGTGMVACPDSSRHPGRPSQVGAWGEAEGSELADARCLAQGRSRFGPAGPCGSRAGKQSPFYGASAATERTLDFIPGGRASRRKFKRQLSKCQDSCMLETHKPWADGASTATPGSQDWDGEWRECV